MKNAQGTNRILLTCAVALMFIVNLRSFWVIIQFLIVSSAFFALIGDIPMVAASSLNHTEELLPAPISTVTRSQNVVDCAFQGSWQRQSFALPGRYWTFYLADYDLHYATSVDGSAWTTYGIGVDAGCSNFSIETNGRDAVFYVRGGIFLDTGGLVFRQGRLNHDGTITWTPEILIIESGNQPSLHASTTGQMFLTYSGSAGVFAIHTKGDDFSSWVENTYLCRCYRAQLAKLRNGRIFAVALPGLGPADRPGLGLQGFLWNGVWNGPEKVSPASLPVQDLTLLFSKDNHLYVFWECLNCTVGGKFTIYFASRGEHGWSLPERAFTILATCDGCGETSMSFDRDVGVFYLFNIEHKNTPVISEYKGRSGDWRKGTTAVLLPPYIGESTLTSWLTSAREPEQIGLSWTQSRNNSGGFPYNLEFASVRLGIPEK